MSHFDKLVNANELIEANINFQIRENEVPIGTEIMTIENEDGDRIVFDIEMEEIPGLRTITSEDKEQEYEVAAFEDLDLVQTGDDEYQYTNVKSAGVVVQPATNRFVGYIMEDSGDVASEYWSKSEGLTDTTQSFLEGWKGEDETRDPDGWYLGQRIRKDSARLKLRKELREYRVRVQTAWINRQTDVKKLVAGRNQVFKKLHESRAFCAKKGDWSAVYLTKAQAQTITEAFTARIRELNTPTK